MNISAEMNVWTLAEMMGNDATKEEAAEMRVILISSNYNDTSEIGEAEWDRMVRTAYGRAN